jgi:hypothetical protein
VPVLSLHMTLVLPSVSTAGKRLTMALTFAMRYIPMARAPVTMAGSASGTAATAKLIAHKIMLRMGRFSIIIPTTPTLTATTTQRIPIHLPTPLKRFSRGPCSSGLLAPSERFFQTQYSCLKLQLQLCLYRKQPRFQYKPGFGGRLAEFAQAVLLDLLTGEDSPVREASSFFMVKASKSLASAGTLSTV